MSKTSFRGKFLRLHLPMNDKFKLPDGTTVGTGLHIPVSKSSSLPEFESVGPMSSKDDIIAALKTGKYRGHDKFDDTYIFNQLEFGSCNGWAEAIALTKSRVRRLQPRVDLSGAYAYSLINGGRDNGSMLEDAMKAVGTHGVAPLSIVGPRQVFRNQYDTAKADAEAAKYKGFEAYAVGSELGLWSAVVAGFDCVVAVHADNGFMKLDSRGVAQGGYGPGNHAVSVDGGWYDDTKQEIVADGVNQWGLSYGNRGRMGLTWKQHFVHTFPYHMFYAIRSTIDSPDDPIPPMGNP